MCSNSSGLKNTEYSLYESVNAAEALALGTRELAVIDEKHCYHSFESSSHLLPFGCFSGACENETQF